MSVQIVTRAEARAAGLKRYFTGEPCKRGHVDERQTSNNGCRACQSDKTKKHRTDTKDSPIHKAKIKASRAKHYRNNSERLILGVAQWRAQPHARAAVNARSRAKRATATGSLNKRISGGIYKSIGSAKVGRSWESLVGYTVEQLRVHIERQFTKGMAWENRGLWEIDHITPLASFSFTSADCPDFKVAWSITNLRPLWAVKNRSKGAKLEVLL